MIYDTASFFNLLPARFTAQMVNFPHCVVYLAN